jgi:hypothetical protein
LFYDILIAIDLKVSYMLCFCYHCLDCFRLLKKVGKVDIFSHVRSFQYDVVGSKALILDSVLCLLSSFLLAKQTEKLFNDMRFNERKRLLM